MDKFETHLHTGNTSYCALVAPELIAEIYAKCGYKGIIVSDHYMQYVLDRNGEQNFTKKIDNLLSGYRTVKKEGEQLGMVVWLGAEVHLERYSEHHMPSQEYLLYGEKLEEVLYSNPYLNNYTQNELFDLCCENDLLMFQAHPFRAYCTRGEPQFLHGIEVFNGNPRHDSNNGTAMSYAREHKLFKISGGDFHQNGDENRAGVFLPSGTKKISEMIELIKARELKLYIGD